MQQIVTNVKRLFVVVGPYDKTSCCLRDVCWLTRTSADTPPGGAGRGSGRGHALGVAAAGLVEFRGQGAGCQGPFELLDGAEHAAAARDQLVLEHKGHGGASVTQSPLSWQSATSPQLTPAWSELNADQ